MEVYGLLANQSTTEVKNQYIPLKSFEEIFDAIIKHLVVQNERSESFSEEYVDNNSCSYRGENNYKCAIGCIINDKFYDEVIEGSTADVDEVILAIQNSNPDLDINGDMQTLFMLMQNLHDKIKPDFWFYVAFLYYRDMNFILQCNTVRFIENTKHSFGFPMHSYSVTGTATNTIYEDAAYKMHYQDMRNKESSLKELFMTQLQANPSISVREFFKEHRDRMNKLAEKSLHYFNIWYTPTLPM